MAPAALVPLSVRDYGASHGSHDHGHFQVLVGLRGVLELEVAGRGHCLGVGHGFVVPPGERHDFESKRGAQCLVLDSTSMGWASAPSAPTAQVTHLATYLAHACAQGLSRAQHLGPACCSKPGNLHPAPCNACAAGSTGTNCSAGRLPVGASL